MLSKRCVFIGVILYSILTIVISAANAASLQIDKAVRNKLIQADWRARAYTEISHEKYLIDDAPGRVRKAWITDEKYKESIVEVIGKAIGDCLENMNEFDPENMEVEGVITFKKTDPSSYSQKNWNAVLLYNYVYFIVNEVKREKYEEMEKEYIDERKDAEEIANWLKKIKTYYISLNKNIDVSKIDDAWRNILTYNDAFQIYSVLSEYLNYLMAGMEPAIYHDDDLNCYKARRSITDYHCGHRALYTLTYSFVNNLTLCVSAIKREPQKLRYGNTDTWVTSSDCWQYIIYGKKFQCKTAQNIMSLFNGLCIETTEPSLEQIKKYDIVNNEYSEHKPFWDDWDGAPLKRFYSTPFYF